MVTTDEHRREMLAWLIQENGGMMKVARESGVSRGHIRRLVRGYEDTKAGRKAYSLLDADPHTISGLLAAFSLTLPMAWEMFNVPSNLRPRWRAFSDTEIPTAAAVSSGEVPLDTSPLLGTVYLPAGHGLTVLTDRSDVSGLQIVTVDGQLYALPPAAVHPQAQRHGGFVGVRISDGPESL